MDNREATYLVCKKPFEWLEIDADKHRTAYLCCSGWLTKAAGKTIDPISMSINDLDLVWNSNNAKEIRKSVLDGSFRYCNKILCPHLNEISGPVQYVSRNELDSLNQLAFGSNHFAPKQLNCAYDRSCNLACPSCRKNIIASESTEREFNNTYLRTVLDKYGDALLEINITGSGDPFGSRHFWDILRSQTLKKYPNLKIILHTNAQLLTAKRWNQIEHITDQIKLLEISIDAASEATYTINRFPASWNRLLENMAIISNFRKNCIIPLLKLDYVVQENNWREMKEFITMARRWNADIIYFSPLNNWGTFEKYEFNERCVHSPNNVNYNEFVAYLSDPIFWASDIEMGSFATLIKRKQISEPT
jgi:hypothetical protein